MFFNYFIVPVAASFGHPIEGIADPEHMENLVLALCGIGAYRSFEKLKGLTR
jgi:hypothetical protein